MLVALTAILVLIGGMIGGKAGLIIALGLALAMNFGSFWFSDKMVIAMTRAKPVTPAEAPRLHEMVERLSRRAGIPKPKVYVVHDPSPNAFATGRDPAHGVVAVNTGLLDLLDNAEVEGVVAHELAHIKHRDTLTMAIVASVAGAIMFLSMFARFAALFGGRSDDGESPLVLLVVAIFAPLAAMMVQMGISRAREYEADRMGAEIAGSPHGLANALAKLDQGIARVPGRVSPEVAHLMIANPFKGLGGIANLFSTHPPAEERIRRLRAMG